MSLAKGGEDMTMMEIKPEDTIDTAKEFFAALIARVKEPHQAEFRRALVTYVTAVRSSSTCSECSIQSRCIRDAACNLGVYDVLEGADMRQIFAFAEMMHDPETTIPSPKKAAAA